ncbi:spore gernimation protein [Paenibacillus sp. 481]|nr:spore gernimation protein [Paenibacillus sp. 481]
MPLPASPVGAGSAKVVPTTPAKPVKPTKPATPSTSGKKGDSNKAFRQVKQVGSVVTYTIKGEASLFEGTYNYAVKQGGKVVATGFGTASKGGPEWGTFTQAISIPANKLSGKQPLTLEMFEMDQESGKAINKVVMSLSTTPSKKVAGNKVFRQVKHVNTAMTYTVKGEANVFEGAYQYAVKQGNTVVAKGFGEASKGGPEWGTFTQKVTVPANKLSGKQPLTLEIFEVDQADGAIKNKMTIVLK